MANLNRENLIKVDIKNATVSSVDGNMTFYTTDKKTCNIFCQLVTNKSSNPLIKDYIPVENARDYRIMLRVIKPNNEPKELEFTLLKQLESEAFFMIDLTDEYKDKIGTYKCEIFIISNTEKESGEIDEEIVTTNSFTYRVNGSIMNDLDDIIDDGSDNPLIEALATKDYVDNIVYVIDKTEAEEGITYEDFKNGGCTCKLSGSLYFGDTYFTFDDELVYIIKTDYSNMKKLYVYRITTVARPGGGATADYIILDYKEGTYEAYNYMLEEIEHKADQVKLDLLNIIDDANYAPVTYVNDSMRTVNETTREYVNGCVENIVNDISAAEYATESYVNDKVLVLRTDFANNFAPLSYVDNAITNAMNGINLSNYATHSYVSNLFNASIDGRLTDYATKDYVGDEIRKLSNSMLNFSDIEFYMEDYLWTNEYTTKDYVAEQIANAQLGGGEGGSVDLSGYATIEYVDGAIANIEIPEIEMPDLSDYATTEYIDGIISVIDKGDATGEITYDDFADGQMPYKLNGTVYFTVDDKERKMVFRNEIAYVDKRKVGPINLLRIWRTRITIDTIDGPDYLYISNGETAGYHYFATQSYVDNAIANIEIPDVDLTDYATKEELNNKVDKSYVHTYVNGYVNNFLGDIESLLEEI